MSRLPLEVIPAVVAQAVQSEDYRALTVNGLLATKAHAILDRRTRRDFFDLYVLLETHKMGLGDVLRALTEVYGEPVNQGLMLRALGYFEDAAAEAPLPGEGRGDFKVVQEFFQRALGALVVPPCQGLKIQAKSSSAPRPPRAKKTAVGPKRKRS